MTTINGTSGDDTLLGTSAAETISGGDGNDVITGGAGNDEIYGGKGTDTASFSGVYSNYNITTVYEDKFGVSSLVGYSVAALSGTDGTDLVFDVEYLTFSSGSYRLDAGSVVSLNGSSSADAVSGSPAADTLYGYAGNDSLMGGAGNDMLDGGDGSDTAVYSSGASNFQLSLTNNQLRVQDNSGAEGTDTLLHIERLQFTDLSVNLTIQQIAQSSNSSDVNRLIELYVAFFNRVPDADGLEYWIGQFNGGQSTNAIAESFYSAGVQYTALTGFSSSMSNADFVNVIYRNVLGRQDGADADGLAYWTGELASGRASRGSLVSTILDSAHTFKGNATWGWVADLLDNKIAVSQQFAIDWGLNYNTPENSISNGMAIAAAITATNTASAIALIGIASGQFELSS